MLTPQASYYTILWRGEVIAIRKQAHINLIVYRPTTVNSQLALAQRVADVHATTVIQRITALNCPAAQKLELLDAVIQTSKDTSPPNHPQNF